MESFSCVSPVWRWSRDPGRVGGQSGIRTVFCAGLPWFGLRLSLGNQFNHQSTEPSLPDGVKDQATLLHLFITASTLLWLRAPWTPPVSETESNPLLTAADLCGSIVNKLLLLLFDLVVFSVFS